MSSATPRPDPVGTPPGKPAPTPGEPPGAQRDPTGITLPVPPPTPPPLAAGQIPEGVRLGKYVRTKRLGSGGMGEVWRAWDTGLSRWVALKLLRPGQEDVLAWFEREARLAAHLSHPHIAAVYEIGVDRDQHFIAMQLIEGATLAEFPRKDRRLLVSLLRDASFAAGRAHEEGIVHRDLKPENFMVESRAASSDGSIAHHIFVMDFGVARPMGKRSDLTIVGTAVGTPVFMSPEQARGEQVSARADVYSLGATLYELLVGRPPIQGSSAQQTLNLIQTREPVPLRAIDPSIDPDLETIVLHCLHKEPGLRYANGTHLAEDLDRWLRNEPILARPPSLAYRGRRWLFRNRTTGIAVAVTAALAVFAAFAAWPAFERARVARARAERALRLGSRVSSALNDAELNARAGEIARSRVKLSEAADLCRREIAAGELPEAHLFLGRIARALGDRREAGLELDRAVQLDPGLNEARLERGLLHIARYEARLAACLAMMGYVRRGPGPPLPPTNQEIENDWPDLAALRKDVQADLEAPIEEALFVREVDRQFGLAELFRIRGEVPAARAALEKILAEEPMHAAALVSKGKLAESEGRVDAALEDAGKAIERHAGYAEAWQFRGLLELRKAALYPADQAEAATGMRERALADLEHAVKLGLELPETLIARGVARQQLGDLKGAAADYTSALALDPGNLYALIDRAGARELSGDREGAVADYKEALRVAPAGFRYVQALQAKVNELSAPR